jgi:hypothetical protein
VILVDTSVWIDHLRAGDAQLAVLLNGSEVLMHPVVLGELACGNLSNREVVFRLLKGLPQAVLATDDEVLFFIDQRGLMGRGMGYMDAHLLAAASLSGPAKLWTRDRRLRAVADSLALGFEKD